MPAAAVKHRKQYTETSKAVIIPKTGGFTSKYRAWVAKNAYLVGTIAIFFFITWVVEVVTRILF